MEVDCEQRITKVEESTKSAHHRIDALEGGQKEIRDLALSVNTLAMSVKSLCEDMTGVSGRVQELESKPSKRWEQLIYVLVAAAVGYFIARI